MLIQDYIMLFQVKVQMVKQNTYTFNQTMLKIKNVNGKIKSIVF